MAQRMSSVDAAWLHMEDPTNLMMITGLLWFAEPVDWARVKRTLWERLVQPYPRFRKRIASSTLPMSLPSWEDDPHFDFDAHFHRVAVPEPGDQAALEGLVSDVMSTPLDLDRPLWHIYLIDGVDGGSAMLHRLHHSIGDGIALTRVLLSLTDDRPDAPVGTPTTEQAGADGSVLDRLVAPAVAAARTAGQATGVVWREGTRVLASPGRLGSLAGRVGELAGQVGSLAGQAGGAAAHVARLASMSADAATRFKGQLGVRKKAAWSDPVDLEAVKSVAATNDATVNDVLLTAVTGALRRYLALHGEMVDDLRAFIPVNLRPLDQPVPTDLGNQFGLVFLSLPVGLGEAADRLDELQRRMIAIKDSPEAAIVYGMLNMLGGTNPEVEKRMVNLLGTKATAVMSNVPGPQEPVYLAGSEVAGLMFWAPQSGHVGLGVSIFSYNGGVRVGVSVDAGLVDDPDTIIEAFYAEFASLTEELGPSDAAQDRGGHGAATAQPAPAAGRGGSGRAGGR
jgi:WS/DGAT/MGAT family acyltransferase